MTQDEDFRKHILSQIKDKDCFDLLRQIMVRLCTPQGSERLKKIMTSLPQATGTKLKNLIYMKNVTLSDGDLAVRKVYQIRRLTELSQTPTTATL